MTPTDHRRCVYTIKGLAADAIHRADSGHPGMPLGAADMATVLWTRFLKHDPAEPTWADRDRFVLSAGHGSMLLYSLLHLSGYDLSLDDLRSFRQWGSRTPGHPEFGHTPGVETTAGPLGQGVAVAVGLAMAERWKRETYGDELCDHRVWCIAGDGCLMEGVAAEAASLAGHLKLDRLTLLYDDNQITIDGSTDITFTEDVGARFEAYGWHVQHVDGHDAEAVASALTAATAETQRPSLICARTVIGQGSLKQGTSATHGSPLSAPDIAQLKEHMGRDPQREFVVPAEVLAAFREHGGPQARAAWQARVAAHPRGAELLAALATTGDELVAKVAWPSFAVGSSVATRKATQACLKAITKASPFVLGGSADLAGSNGTDIGVRAFTPASFAGAATVNFGIREHAMGAICNGLALHGGITPYCATFLVFHDYMRPAVRLAALMGLGVIYVYTHDSVFLGEDGPTHQPVETLLALRCVPNLLTIRPADAAETAEAWKIALARRSAPTALALTRQGLPTLDRTVYGAVEGVHQGGYVLSEAKGALQVVLMGSGSEVQTLLDAQTLLESAGVHARVVSVPCRELLWEQDRAYRDAVLPVGVPRVSLEAGLTLGWERYIGDSGLAIGIDTFGFSAPAEVIAEKIGFTPAAVAARVQAHLAR